MTFREFFELYKRDKEPRIRENTWRTKEAIVMTKIMPYLGDLLMNEISNVAIIQWQNELMKIKDDRDRKSTRLNSSHANISYAVFCLKKKKILKNKQICAAHEA